MSVLSLHISGQIFLCMIEYLFLYLFNTYSPHPFSLGILNMDEQNGVQNFR